MTTIGARHRRLTTRYHGPMAETIITLDDDLLHEVERAAAERDLSIDELVGKILREKLANQRPRPQSLGIIATSETDIARRTGDERPVPEPWR